MNLSYIYICYIHGLQPFQNNTKFHLCDIIQEKYKRGNLMAKIFFPLHQVVNVVFHNKIYISTI